MRIGNAAENMEILRHSALNLLKAESSFSANINLKRRSAYFLLLIFSKFLVRKQWQWKDQVRKSVNETLNKLLDSEFKELTKAAKYECKESQYCQPLSNNFIFQTRI